MTADTHIPQGTVGRSERRRPPAVLVAAGCSACMTVIYLLIGARLVDVIQPADDQPVFGFVAAGFFALLTAVLLLIRRPLIWLLALATHLFVVFVYVDLAPERVPHYETWGLVLRGLQVPAIVALGRLVTVDQRSRARRRNAAI